MTSVHQQIGYKQQDGFSTGEITISFSDIPNTILQKIINNTIVICENAKTANDTKEKEPRIKTEKKPSPAPGKMPKVEGRASSWEYKFIKAEQHLDDLFIDFYKRFPKTKVTKETLEDLWKYYHPVSTDKSENEKTAPRTETDPKPGEQITINSKVVQVKGIAPGVGIGTVLQIKKDGTVKVQFFNQIKVLPLDHFSLATTDDANLRIQRN